MVVTISVGATANETPAESLPLGPRYALSAASRLSGARAAVLRALTNARAAATVTALADQLGQHPNTVREHLDALVADGRASRTRSTPVGRGRPAWLYRAIDHATAGDDGGLLGDGPYATDGQEYIALAVALIDQVSDSSPNPGALGRRAGERWGRTLAARYRNADSHADSDAVGSVVGILRDLRFEPRLGDDPKSMRLTTCPFLDAARRHPDVVCQVHLGIVRGAVACLGGDPDTADLRAFAEPGACLLTLSEVQ